jgi:hypothetical protein
MYLGLISDWNLVEPAYFWFECFFFISVGGHKEVITTPEIYELQAPF